MPARPRETISRMVARIYRVAGKVLTEQAKEQDLGLLTAQRTLLLESQVTEVEEVEDFERPVARLEVVNPPNPPRPPSFPSTRVSSSSTMAARCLRGTS